MKTLKLYVTATGNPLENRYGLPITYDISQKSRAEKEAIEESERIQYNSDRGLTADMKNWETFEEWKERNGENAGKILIGAYDDYSRCIVNGIPSRTGGSWHYIIEVREEGEE